jgi:hypothetical protein
MTWHTAKQGREVTGLQENDVGTQQPSTTAEHCLSTTVQTLPADTHTSAASGRLNCHPCQVTWTCPFRRKRNRVSACVPSNLNCSISGLLDKNLNKRDKTKTPQPFTSLRILTAFLGWSIAARMPRIPLAVQTYKPLILAMRNSVT